MPKRGVWEADSLPEYPEKTSSASHVIRLRGPWKCEMHKSTASISPEILTIELPLDWNVFLRERSCDSMVWRRSFGRPTNLGHRERVELVISHLRADVVVWLNEVQFAPTVRSKTRARFDVTNRLDVRNQLALEVPTPSSESLVGRSECAVNEDVAIGPFEQVYLELLSAD